MTAYAETAPSHEHLLVLPEEPKIGKNGYYGPSDRPLEQSAPVVELDQSVTRAVSTSQATEQPTKKSKRAYTTRTKKLDQLLKYEADITDRIKQVAEVADEKGYLDEAAPWQVRGVCNDDPTEIYYAYEGHWGAPLEDAAREARMSCVACFVKTNCLRYAIENGEEYGIWAGFTGEEIRSIRRSNRQSQYLRMDDSELENTIREKLNPGLKKMLRNLSDDQVLQQRAK